MSERTQHGRKRSDQNEVPAPVAVLQSCYIILNISLSRLHSYIEHATEVTLHKLVDGAWQTEPETVRIDVMHDSSQGMFYVVAQVKRCGR